jgi:plastocyanin
VGALATAAIVLAAPGLFGADGNDKNDNRRNPVVISMIDDCDPDDPNWAPVGCLQRKGDVTAAEFDAFLRSPLYDNIAPFDAEPGRFLVGHPSWRNEPSHVAVKAGREIRVRNDGGRPHTFTPVAQFGGGVIPPLNVGSQTAPECASALRIEPGDRDKFIASGDGIQRYQCCFHPWMRATIRVESKDSDEDEK